MRRADYANPVPKGNEMLGTNIRVLFRTGPDSWSQMTAIRTKVKGSRGS